MKIFLTLCSLFSVCYGLEDASSCYVSEDDMSYKLSPFSSELSLQQTDWGSEGEFTDWGSDDRVSTPSDSSLHFGSYSPTEYGSSVDSFMADISENSVILSLISISPTSA